MKFLLLNQTFRPDVMATAQYLTELALALVARGHEVTVVTGRRAYDDPAQQFPKEESWRGIRIHRVGSTRFGKTARWRRAADFASFMVNCCWRLARLPRQDVTVALTSPPLISFIGAWLARVRGGRFCYWVMDLNPDEAIAAGWLNSDSLAARRLDRFSRFSFRQAARIIALDRFMQDRIAAKGVASGRIEVLPPWSHDDVVRFDAAGRNRFRREHGLEHKFVVMYSGNHSPCHPLDTVLAAAKRLSMPDRRSVTNETSDTSETGAPRDPDSTLTDELTSARLPEIVFCFIGGGSEFKRVQSFAEEHGLANVLCLPYRPLEQLSASLSAADAHLVVMGDPFVGIVHPCKIYNILAVGAPVLYVGPEPSHVTEVLDELGQPEDCASVRHGEADGLLGAIERLRNTRRRLEQGRVKALLPHFGRDALLPRLVAALEAESDTGARR